MLQAAQHLQIRTGETCANPECGQVWARLSAQGLCPSCDRKRRLDDIERQRREFEAAQKRERDEKIAERMGSIEAYATEQLAESGLSPRELKAELSRIPRDVKLAMPQDAVREMLAGEVAKSGWGLFGTTGTGKTMAIAAIVKAHAVAKLKARVPEELDVSTDWIRWESWPILADWLRDHARTDPALVSERLEGICSAKVLVLDDLAAERRVSDYGNDYAIGKLDIIIDRRYRDCLPTWYTANVQGEAGLISAYGARLVSRLCGENRPATVQGPDQRMG